MSEAGFWEGVQTAVVRPSASYSEVIRRLFWSVISRTRPRPGSSLVVDLWFRALVALWVNAGPVVGLNVVVTALPVGSYVLTVRPRESYSKRPVVIQPVPAPSWVSVWKTSPLTGAVPKAFSASYEVRVLESTVPVAAWAHVPAVALTSRASPIRCLVVLWTYSVVVQTWSWTVQPPEPFDVAASDSEVVFRPWTGSKVSIARLRRVPPSIASYWSVCLVLTRKASRAVVPGRAWVAVFVLSYRVTSRAATVAPVPALV